MRDYFRELVEKYSEDPHKDEPTKPTKVASVGFVGSVPNESGENSVTGCSGHKRSQCDARNVILEERKAIMIYDGGSSESDANQYLTVYTEYAANRRE